MLCICPDIIDVLDFFGKELHNFAVKKQNLILNFQYCAAEFLFG